MAWGEEKCTFCDAHLNSDGELSCDCSSKLVYRKQPIPPSSAVRLFFDQTPRNTSWSNAFTSFSALPLEDRLYWNNRYMDDRKRYEKEKREYNEALRLEEEILTDREAENECECRNGYADIRKELERRRCEQTWARYRRDHPKFKQALQAPDDDLGPGTFCRFADLPTEIRDQIYYYVFKGSNNATELRQWQLEFEAYGTEPEHCFTHLQPLDTRILAVSHRIYSEALEVLYCSNTFVVDVSKNDVLPLFVQDATGSQAPRPTSKIKRWHIILTFTNIAQDFAKAFQDLRDVMELCIRLDEVRFTWISIPRYWAELPALTTAYGKLLEPFKQLRGVGRVIFTEKHSKPEAEKHIQFLSEWEHVHLPSEDVRQAVKARMESPSDD